MTVMERHGSRVLGVLLAFALLLGLAGLSTKGEGIPARLPDHDDYILNAKLTVSTQKLSYNVNGGIRGIDVSKYQGNIDWNRVAGDDVEFAFIRSSYGMTEDPYFFHNAQNAHESGVKVGAYHYATFTNSAELRQEAKYFLDRLSQVNVTYPVVLDLEGASHKRLGRKALTDLAIEFMDVMEANGYRVMLYTYNNFLRDYLDADRLEGYDKWLANYLEHPASYDHTVWQHSNTGRVNGIAGYVDLNVSYQDLSRGGSRYAEPADNEDERGSEPGGDLSSSIRETLYGRYGVDLSVDSAGWDEAREAITIGIQSEIARQWGIDYPATGYADAGMIDHLAEVNYTPDTHGNIMYLLQTKLAYLGYYKNYPSSWNDDETRDAISRFQIDQGFGGDGTLDWDTLAALLL